MRCPRSSGRRLISRSLPQTEVKKARVLEGKITEATDSGISVPQTGNTRWPVQTLLPQVLATHVYWLAHQQLIRDVTRERPRLSYLRAPCGSGVGTRCEAGPRCPKERLLPSVFCSR